MNDRSRSTGRGRRAAGAVVLLGTVLAACTSPTPVEFPDGTGGVVSVESADSSAPLSFRGSDLVDAEGRTVQIHGINMVRKSAPYHVAPDEPGFEATLEEVRRSGFNGVRLGIRMSELMPTPGVVDTEYLEAVTAGLDALVAEDLWIMLDFHQDLFTGMPDWATTPATAALSADPPGGPGGFWALAYFSPRSSAQWEDLYSRVPVDGDRSAVDLMGDAIAAVADRFSDEPNVIGIDLLNEPWPGNRFLDCLLGTCTARYAQLQSIYEEYTSKIREVAPDMAVWWAPFNWGAPFQGSPGPSTDRVGVTYHSYCLHTDGGEPVAPDPIEHALCGGVYEVQTDDALALGRSWNAPVLLGEFGASASPLNTTRLAQLADRHQLSWMYWDDNYYRQAPEVVRTDLVRTYPQAVAGTVTTQRFDPASGAFDLRYTADHSIDAPTSIVVPTEAYPDGYEVSVTGAAVSSGPDAGRLTLVADEAAAQVTVRVTRR